MNTEKEGPLTNLKVRQALQYAVNEDRLFKTIFYGYGEKAKQCVPSTWWGHNPSIPAYEYNPERAKKLLAEAGYPNGFKITFLGFTDPRPYCPAPTDYVTLVKSDLEKIGVKVDIRMMLWNSYRAERVKGNFDLCLAGYSSGTQDTDALVYAMFHSSRTGLENIARLRSPIVDRLLDEGRSIYDTDKRAKIYQQLASEIHKISPWLMSVHPIVSLAARSEVKNIFIHGSTWVPLHKVNLE
jgi:peptide/nickel transport system substrate-binding protein